MVIQADEPWGEPFSAGPQQTLPDDASLAAAAFGRLDPDSGHGVTTRRSDLYLSVESGDVLRTVGLTANRDPADQWCYPFDIGLARLDGGDPIPFVAHLQARRRRWSGMFLVAMNVSWSGERYLGPKAHPNDGLLDITTGSLDVRQRLLARPRTLTGTHIPHPNLKIVRRPHYEVEFDSLTPVYVDGQRSGSCRQLEVNILPDAFGLVA